MKNPDFKYELALLDQGFSVVAGIDEVGRGCWAGPVVAAAVIFSEHHMDGLINDIRDSKLLSAKKREALNQFIQASCDWGIGEASNQEIDSLGISQATHLAMLRAIEQLTLLPDHLIIDGREKLDTHYEQQSIIDGDALSISIAAASIIAKVYRDQLMTQYDIEYPGYQFSKHVGYGTKDHLSALKHYGVTKIHRLSYKPIQAILKAVGD